jgi:hypothetical protein
MRTVHVGKETRTFSCDQCPYTVHAQRYLNEHVKLFHDPSKVNREWRPQRKANHENSALTKKEPSSIKVVYMSFSFLQLAVGSPDLSQA